MAKNIFDVNIPIPGSQGLTASGAYRIYSLANPLTNISAINNLTSAINYGNNDPSYVKQSFRYSTDNQYWSQWYNFDSAQSILQVLSFSPTSPLYIAYKLGYDNGTTDTLQTPVTLDNISAQFITDVPKPSLRMTPTVSNEFLINVYASKTSTFNLYNSSAWAQINIAYSYAMMNLIGHDAVYFRTSPDKTGTDFIFREHTLFDVAGRKCIKVVAKDNNFPDDEFEFRGDGMHTSQPFEVHIDKQYFEDNFGVGAQPRKNDFMYIPLINRIFSVGSVSLQRGAMKVELFWKLRLSKFQRNINLKTDEETTKFLDNMLISSDDAFGEEVQDQISNALMPQQFSPTPTTTADETRQSMDTSLMVNETKVDFNYTRLINYFYDMNTPASDYGVVYNNQFILSTENDAAICFMLRLKNGTASFTTVASYDNATFDISGAYNANTKNLAISILGNSVSIANVSIDKWYSVFINVSTIFKQLNISFYDITENPSSKGKFYKFIPMLKKDFNNITIPSINCKLGLKKGLYDIANIRVFNKCMQVEDQQYIISELVIKDEKLLTIIDNSRPRMNTPFIMQKY